MILSLRSGSKVYINGAVLRVDRKVNLELLNDVTFLLESHVLQAHEATTPLRQLYFVLQTILMDPSGAAPARGMAAEMLTRLIASFADTAVLDGLQAVRGQVERCRLFEAMRTLRALYPVEAGILAGAKPAMVAGQTPAPVQAA
jgi:flagellar protein FlbT